MRIVLGLLLASAAVHGGAQAPADSRREVSNVAAFTRLYGAVRYFYPSDGLRREVSAIEQCRDCRGVAEQFAPSIHGSIRGQERGRAFVATHDLPPEDHADTTPRSGC